MTFHTILPLEIVLDGFGDPNRMRRTVEIRTGGMLLEVEPVGDGLGRIVRLLDCPLDAYLDPALNPGNLIRMHP
jgi:hypothetical protein